MCIRDSSGVLVSANVTEGSLITPGQELGEFIAPGDYELMVALPKSYVSKIAKGSSVKVKSIDTDQIYSGIVSRINAKVNSKTQSVEVYVRMSDSRLKEGMYMEADINAMEFSNVFALDRGLINGSQQIYIVKDNKLILQKVNPIHFTETLAIIRGLDDGEGEIQVPISGLLIEGNFLFDPLSPEDLRQALRDLGANDNELGDLWVRGDRGGRRVRGAAQEREAAERRRDGRRGAGRALAALALPFLRRRRRRQRLVQVWYCELVGWRRLRVPAARRHRRRRRHRHRRRWWRGRPRAGVVGGQAARELLDEHLGLLVGLDAAQLREALQLAPLLVVDRGADGVDRGFVQVS